jgi:hypothetical protein
MEEQPVHVTTTEARAGGGPRVMRYVLIVSLVLVILALVSLGLARQF